MQKIIKIEGMHCGNCTSAVEKALKELTGITSVAVSLDAKQAIIEMTSEIPETELKNAVEDIGFDVIGIV